MKINDYFPKFVFYDSGIITSTLSVEEFEKPIYEFLYYTIEYPTFFELDIESKKKTLAEFRVDCYGSKSFKVKQYYPTSKEFDCDYNYLISFFQEEIAQYNNNEKIT